MANPDIGSRIVASMDAPFSEEQTSFVSQGESQSLSITA
ncbi:Hypothetical protein Cul131001_1108 [Corynebacterium ulcerans]|nr:Hypothetical protein Cul05146_1111 [Corynebacterium ulcerans]AKA96604.1 Hypothetical protein CUL131002_1072c [Corynebacterium ulcerans]ALD94815.1 Hypothetical protein Cul131001_1108 [Corynebacterium ulcerans]